MDDIQDSTLLRKFRSNTIPFVALLVFSVLLALRIAWPLTRALAWSAVLSFFTYPVYRFIHVKIFRGRWAFIAATLNTALIVFFMVLPMLGLLGAAIKELYRAYQFFVEWLPTVRDRPLGP